MLFFIGQALAIAAIGYVVSHAFAHAPTHGDPVTSEPVDFRSPAVPASADAQTQSPALHLSFVPESVGGSEDLAAYAGEDAVRSDTTSIGTIDASDRRRKTTRLTA